LFLYLRRMIARKLRSSEAIAIQVRDKARPKYKIDLSLVKGKMNLIYLRNFAVAQREERFSKRNPYASGHEKRYNTFFFG